MVAPKNEVYFRDCIQGMKEFSDKQFKLACVDTNWGIGESSKDHKSRNTGILQKTGKILRAPRQIYTKQDWDKEQAIQAYFDELFRVAEKIIIMGENYLQFAQKSTSSGRIVWDKVTTGDYSDGEIFWTNIQKTVTIIPYMWNGMFQGKSLQEPRVQQPNKKLNEKRSQPAHKPVFLYVALYQRYAKPGDNILDTHVGGGSSRIAAWDMGLDYTGFEHNIVNFNNQHKRFENHKIAVDLHRGY